MDKDFQLYGIFGFPLSHTLSPVIQEAAFFALQRNRPEKHSGKQAVRSKAFYLPFEVSREEFRYVMRNRRKLLLDGFNVTVPYKQEVIKYLDTLTSEARAIGAVNTVYRKNGGWAGANTDLYGFLTSLRREGKFSPRGKRVLVLGAGGSARAVVYGLAKSGCREIRIANRSRFCKRREKIIRDFRHLFPQTSFVSLSLNQKDLKRGMKGVDLVVNCTAVGVVYETKSLIPAGLVPRAGKKRLIFFDLIYHKPTRFLEVARQKGHRAINGMGMLLYQGAEAFRLWTGKKPPVKVMRAALRKALHGRSY